MSMLGMVLCNEEIGRVSWALQQVFQLSIPALGGLDVSDYQRDKYVLPITRGERTFFWAVTEPDAGSDVARIKTRAVRDGDNYILNGTKCFITNAIYSAAGLIVARTDSPDKPGPSLSAFWVDVDTPGFKIARQHKTMGFRGMGASELVMEDCVVPAKNLLGEEGAAFAWATKKWLPYGRIWVSATCLALAQRLVEAGREYAKQRVAFGRPISDYQAIQFMLVECAVEIHAARMMLYDAAWDWDQGRDILTKASIVKLFTTEMAGRVVDRVLQIHGGSGYADSWIERAYRDLRVMRLIEGTSEIHKRLIARSLLK